MTRINSYLQPAASEAKVMKTLRKSLLSNPQERLLDQDSGLIRMLDEQSSEGKQEVLFLKKFSKIRRVCLYRNAVIDFFRLTSLPCGQKPW